jgi:hypothetical protein
MARTPDSQVIMNSCCLAIVVQNGDYNKAQLSFLPIRVIPKGILWSMPEDDVSFLCRKTKGTNKEEKEEKKKRDRR